MSRKMFGNVSGMYRHTNDVTSKVGEIGPTSETRESSESETLIAGTSAIQSAGLLLQL